MILFNQMLRLYADVPDYVLGFKPCLFKLTLLAVIELFTLGLKLCSYLLGFFSFTL